ncbi:hypothetical protein MTR67_006904 [Solanum verrucosum]|uniref:Uncharacterized protein n=1 Tax=Solanum verrucosum TaxID=315347 RepID=A0AAF0Q505_SOLVR|nr:hypothetical protein MTR67_006904 [Solanum verrucosum]
MKTYPQSHSIYSLELGRYEFLNAWMLSLSSKQQFILIQNLTFWGQSAIKVGFRGLFGSPITSVIRPLFHWIANLLESSLLILFFRQYNRRSPIHSTINQYGTQLAQISLIAAVYCKTGWALKPLGESSSSLGDCQVDLSPLDVDLDADVDHIQAGDTTIPPASADAQRSVVESKARMEQMMDRKIQAFNKRLDAFESRVLKRHAPTIDITTFHTELASLCADVDALLAPA